MKIKRTIYSIFGVIGLVAISFCGLIVYMTGFYEGELNETQYSLLNTFCDYESGAIPQGKPDRIILYDDDAGFGMLCEWYLICDADDEGCRDSIINYFKDRGYFINADMQPNPPPPNFSVYMIRQNETIIIYFDYANGNCVLSVDKSPYAKF